uniref:Uncharacterized protein n=1 Tax=Lutzomyia longipalpis TaxID=7200 RepID=A0A1B0CB77_LUTLO
MYVRNEVLLNDLDIQPVKEVARERSKTYKARLEAHPRAIVEKDVLREPQTRRRLQRHWPSDLLMPYSCSQTIR